MVYHAGIIPVRLQPILRVRAPLHGKSARHNPVTISMDVPLHERLTDLSWLTGTVLPELETGTRIC